jgi:hypothetical protein
MHILRDSGLQRKISVTEGREHARSHLWDGAAVPYPPRQNPDLLWQLPSHACPNYHALLWQQAAAHVWKLYVLIGIASYSA